MYVCMYVFMYVCIYVCKYACMYVFMHVCLCTCMYYVCVCTYVHIDVCIMHVYKCVFMYIFTYICTYVCMFLCMYVLCTYISMSLCEDLPRYKQFITVKSRTHHCSTCYSTRYKSFCTARLSQVLSPAVNFRSPVSLCICRILTVYLANVAICRGEWQDI